MRGKASLVFLFLFGLFLVLVTIRPGPGLPVTSFACGDDGKCAAAIVLPDQKTANSVEVELTPGSEGRPSLLRLTGLPNAPRNQIYSHVDVQTVSGTTEQYSVDRLDTLVMKSDDGQVLRTVSLWHPNLKSF